MRLLGRVIDTEEYTNFRFKSRFVCKILTIKTITMNEKMYLISAKELEDRINELIEIKDKFNP